MSDSTPTRRPLRIVLIVLAAAVVVAGVYLAVQVIGAGSLENFFAGFKAM